MIQTRLSKPPPRFCLPLDDEELEHLYHVIEHYQRTLNDVDRFLEELRDDEKAIKYRFEAMMRSQLNNSLRRKIERLLALRGSPPPPPHLSLIHI